MESKTKRALIESMERLNPQNLGAICDQEKFDFNFFYHGTDWLSIDKFDNKKYRTRTPTEWIEWFTDEAGVALEMRARGCLLDQETGLRFWGCILVDSWD